jgi:cytochrome c553
MKLINRAASLVLVGIMGVAMAGTTQAGGDAEAGKAKSAVCAACHGADGNSAAGMFPKLAGQGEPYFIKQLADMKSGKRNVPQMTAFLATLTEQDYADLAAYYAGQKIKLGAAKADLVEAGQSVYRAGNPESGVAACAGCHGANGVGVAEAGFPALGGQHAEYIEAQLKAFRAAGRGDESGAKRDNDPNMMMRGAAARLSDSEIKALASYISGLH